MSDGQKAPVARGKLFVMFGPAGSGKTTLINLACQKLGPEKLIKLVTCTTREPRTGEVAGSDYNFVSVEEFNLIRDADGFFETAEYHDNFYGVPMDQLNLMKDGQNLIVATELEGAKKLSEIDGSVIIHLTADKDELEARVRGRCPKVEGDHISQRFDLDSAQCLRAEGELKIDHRLIAHHLETVLADLMAIISEKSNG